MNKIKRNYELIFLRGIPGKAVFKFSSKTKGEPDLDPFLEVDGIEEVSFNKITKGLLVIYDKRISLNNLFSKIKAIKGYQVKILRASAKNPYLEGLPTLHQFVYDSFFKMNDGLLESTKGHADLTSLAPTALLGLGFLQLFRRPEMPPWHVLIWYGLNMYYWRYSHQSGSKAKMKRYMVDEAENMIMQGAYPGIDAGE